MRLLGKYKNGNVFTTIYSDGTKIRMTKDEEFHPEFAENMDIKICNKCDMQCNFCHEGSTPDGKLGNILNEKFVDTLHPYQEVALGGGNVLSHPDLICFLQKLKNKKVITNITLNQKHFEENIDLVKQMTEDKLIYGIGISLINPTTDFIEKIKEFSNAVIHVINGVVDPLQIAKIADQNLKLLILGYKDLRRGIEWHSKNGKSIEKNQNWLKDELPSLINRFQVISFDNLAIEQLEIRDRWNDFSNRSWDEFYAGDEGTSTFYIDMVERKFAKNSIADFNQRYDLLDNVDDMFRIIQEKSNKCKGV